jgi:hypothetical protein
LPHQAATANPGNVYAKLRIRDIEAVGVRGIPDFAQLFSGGQRGFNLEPNPGYPAGAGCRLDGGKRAQMDEGRFCSLRWIWSRGLRHYKKEPLEIKGMGTAIPDINCEI